MNQFQSPQDLTVAGRCLSIGGYTNSVRSRIWTNSCRENVFLQMPKGENHLFTNDSRLSEGKGGESNYHRRHGDGAGCAGDRFGGRSHLIGY